MTVRMIVPGAPHPAGQVAVLDLLRGAGVAKINFAGGEPFLYPQVLGRLVKHAKEIGMYTSVSERRAAPQPSAAESLLLLTCGGARTDHHEREQAQ